MTAVPRLVTAKLQLSTRESNYKGGCRTRDGNFRADLGRMVLNRHHYERERLVVVCHVGLTKGEPY